MTVSIANTVKKIMLILIASIVTIAMMILLGRIVIKTIYNSFHSHDSFDSFDSFDSHNSCNCYGKSFILLIKVLLLTKKDLFLYKYVIFSQIILTFGCLSNLSVVINILANDSTRSLTCLAQYLEQAY